MNQNSMSKLHVICGPMFAGKTEELIRRVKRCVLSEKPIQVFKPAMDFRFGIERITSHGKTDLEVATGVKPVPITENDRFRLDNQTKVVAFDEVQFFQTDWIVEVVKSLLANEISVICAGLDLNTYGDPFESIQPLLAMADEVVKLKAVCLTCKEDATRTYRAVPFLDGVAVEVGGKGLYEPRCYSCWSPTPKV